MRHARRLFDRIPHRDAPLWNAMFKGYSLNSLDEEVLALFRMVKDVGVMPNCFTFPLVLNACIKTRAFSEGRHVHCAAIKTGFKGNPFVGTSLIEMYCCQGDLAAAYRAFGEVNERNVVVWTSMVKGYLLCGDVVAARRLFDLAPVRDAVLWNTMVVGYIECGDMIAAGKLFDVMPDRDVISWNTVLGGYASCGDVGACERLFEEMGVRNVFSWNALLGGYLKSGRSVEILATFQRMLFEDTVSPNDATLVTILSACARLGALDIGKWVHVYAENNGYGENLYVLNALMDMYAKCGIVENSVSLFLGMEKKDLISWNTIINGLAIHGRGDDALTMFQKMKDANVQPDAITYIGILCACTHMGLILDGFSYFRSMTLDHSIMPQIEHYGCMVDLLARAGLLVQAFDFVKEMPMEADAVIWASLLGACRLHKNIDLAEVALNRLIELEPRNPANFVQLANAYGDARKWKDVARLKAAMKDTGFRKQAGCSLIECKGDVVEFYCLDERHHKTEKIYETLNSLTLLLTSHIPALDLDELDQ
ncbi:hypothetical protein MLD38_030303 [Melastoma candidum]|uniref:Uncharacterized protein n=1 Tax=Melastoma candidum TaxID=119954 RepID=A0ACB9MMH2_9MYRT|nr:hypothetical protein MLD38_030303 [Melastoma candidum]